jgi:predicted deacylase
MRAIQIEKQKSKAGKTTSMQLAISRLPTGTLIDVEVKVIQSKEEGPVVLIQGGLHGDEINGIEIVRRLQSELKDTVVAGTVVLVPVLNVFGFIHFSREVPDGKDVNRSFPGSARGSLASRIAGRYSKKLIPQIDWAIDLHTGGAQRFNYPQIRFTEGDRQSEELARQFAPPFMLKSGLIRGSFRRHLHSLGKGVIVYEAGESMRFNESAIQMGVDGVLRLLKAQGMLTKGTKVPKVRETPVLLQESKWLRAPASGMFLPAVQNGQWVKAGDILGEVVDTYQASGKKIKAPDAGPIFCINNQAVVNQGDALFHLGLEQKMN